MSDPDVASRIASAENDAKKMMERAFSPCCGPSATTRPNQTSGWVSAEKTELERKAGPQGLTGATEIAKNKAAMMDVDRAL